MFRVCCLFLLAFLAQFVSTDVAPPTSLSITSAVVLALAFLLGFPLPLV